MEFNMNAAAENTGGGGSSVTETKYIPAGQVPMILFAILELGAHTPMFKGAPAVYTVGKRKGEVKDPEMHFRFIYEAPHLPHDDEPLTLGDSPFDYIGLPEYAFKDNSKITNKMKFYNYISNLVKASGHSGGTFKLSSLLGAKIKINVTNAPVPEDKLPKDAAGNKVANYMYSNFKYMDISSTKVYSSTDPNQVLEDVGVLLPDAPTHKMIYFSWANPDPNAFLAMKPWHREQIRNALNLQGSQVEVMFNMHPNLWTMDDAPEDTDKPTDDTAPPPVPVDQALATPNVVVDPKTQAIVDAKALLAAAEAEAESLIVKPDALAQVDEKQVKSVVVDKPIPALVSNVQQGATAEVVTPNNVMPMPTFNGGN
jgi:hypothetical protein